MDGIPPPHVHVHIRKFNVAHEVPIGDLSASDPSKLPHGTRKSTSPQSEAVETDIPQAEKERFDLWLRDLWRAKDEDMARYLKAGSFVPDESQQFEIPIALKRKREALDAFCFFVPAVLGWAFSRLSR